MTNNNTQGSQEGVYTPEPRVYELGYLLVPTVDEGNLINERDALVALITRYKGIVISEGQPELIDLAYEMSQVLNNKNTYYKQAYFGWIKFDITPNVVETLTEEIESGNTILRSLMIKTVRENTLTSDQPFKLARAPHPSDSEDTDEAPESDDTNESDSGDGDDLTKIEGIGPKIAEVLSEAGMKTYADISTSKVGDLRTLLSDKGLAQHDPSTWKKQATLAKNDKWDELKKLQEELSGGRE